MANDYSVRAKLSALDSGFTSTLKSALGSVNSLGDRIKSGFAFGVLTGAGQAAFSAIGNSVRSLISEIDSSNAAWKNFESNMQIIGASAGEIDSVKKELQDYAQQTVYTASDMASTYAQLAAVGTKNTDQLVKGFGGLAAAAENPQQAMKTLSMQATQMAARPTVAWEDFKLMLEQTPAGIAAVAKQMGMSSSEMVSAIQSGTIATDDFFDAIAAVGNSEGFAKMATTPKTVGQALDGLQESVSNKLTPAFNVLSQVGINAIGSIGDALSGIDADGLADKVSAAVNRVKGLVSRVADTGAFTALKTAVLDVRDAFGNLFNRLSSSGALDKLASGFGTVIRVVSQAVSAVAKFVGGMSGSTLKTAAIGVTGVVAGFKAFSFLKSFNPFGAFKKNAETAADGATKAVKKSKSTISSIISALGGATKNVGDAVKSILQGIGTAVKGIGAGIKTALQGVAPAAKGIGAALKTVLSALQKFTPAKLLALGAAIAIVAASFALLATQSSGVAEILGAIGGVVNGIISTAITSLASALTIIAPVFPVISQALVMLTPLVTAFGAAFSMVANAIGTAISKIITALTPIVQIISTTVTTVVQIIGNIVTQIMAVLQPILPALFSMITQIVSIISDAIVRIVQALAPYMPQIQAMVEATSAAIDSICTAFTALVQQIAPVIQAVTELVRQLGETITSILEGVAGVVESIGGAISGVIESIGGAISGVIDSISGGFAKVLDAIAGIIDSIGNSARNAGEGFKATAEGIKLIAGIPIWSIAKSLGAVAAGLSEMAIAGAGVPEVGTGMQILVTSLLAITAAASGMSMAVQTIVTTVTAMPGALSTALAALSAFTASAVPLAVQLQRFTSFSAAASAAIIVLAAGFLQLAGSATRLGKPLSECVDGVTGIISGARMASSQIRQVASGLDGIKRSAVTSSRSLVDMAAQADSLQAELASLGASGMSNIERVTDALREAERTARQAGDAVGAGFTQAFQRGMNSAKTVATSSMNTITSALQSGYSRAYSAGANIGQGLANGMASMLSRVRNIAAQLVAAADQAIQARARIGSPSKLSFREGAFFGEGFVRGLKDKIRSAQLAAGDLVVAVASSVSGSYDGSLQPDYSYGGTLTLSVPLYLDGREVARATAEYTRDEMGRLQSRDERRHGRR